MQTQKKLNLSKKKLQYEILKLKKLKCEFLAVSEKWTLGLRPHTKKDFSLDPEALVVSLAQNWRQVAKAMVRSHGFYLIPSELGFAFEGRT